MNLFNFNKKKEIEKVSGGADTEATSSKINNETSQNETMEKQQINPSEQVGKENNVKVYNLLILDESGSMSAIYQEAITGVNETLQTIRMAKESNPEQEHYVTLVSFDTGHYNQIYKGIPAEKALDITSRQYRPMGGTPLFDTMGRAITELRNHLVYLDNSSDKNEIVVLVTVITDGYENSSREYSGAAIKALVEEMRKKGWVFTYIGANQDVDKMAESIAINNSMAFQATSEGTKAMFAKERISRNSFYHKLKLPREERDSNFFEN